MQTQIAEQVRRRRKGREWSQFKLAVEAGIHPTTVSLVERGLKVAPETIRKLASALGVSPEELRP